MRRDKNPSAGSMEATISVRRRVAMALLSALSVLLITSCELRPLEEEFREAALIPVKIDWSRSGVNVANDRVTEEVHRVSIRFFPKDGSPAFDRYLDLDVTEGRIEVPAGRYSVIVFNESIHDDGYWSDRIRFNNTESYTEFTANLLPYDEALRAQQFPFYRPAAGEKLIVEPLPLASWSLDDFEVTKEMVSRPSQGRDDFNALTHVVMRRLTYRVNVEARVTNLVSAFSNYCAQRGFASTVYMASGLAANSSTFLFLLNGRHYDTDRLNGTVRATFLSFGRVPPPESYMLAADVLFITGELYTSSGPLIFDVTGQVLVASSDSDIDIKIGLDLPYVDGGITVEEWDDGEYPLE